MHVQEGRGLKTQDFYTVFPLPSCPANPRIHFSPSPLLCHTVHISSCNYRWGQDLFHCFKKEMHPSPCASSVCCLSSALSIHPFIQISAMWGQFTAAIAQGLGEVERLAN